jgi:hypothetical protein
MQHEPPAPILEIEQQARQARVEEIARRFGFIGRVEYRHVATNSGGAQYGTGPSVEQDVLVVYAEAFRRDAAGDDFSLAAIIAHERGHQVILRNERLHRNLPADMSATTEEVLASLVGAMLLEDVREREDLVAKAIVELSERGMPLPTAAQRVRELLTFLEGFL